MKTNSLFISVCLASIMFSCAGAPEKVKQQSLEEISKQELATALEERDQLLALVKEVSEGLEQIKRLENAMTIADAQPGEKPHRKARILADINNLKKMVQQRKAQLQQLEENLQNSTINNKELHETIHALRVQIDSQIDEIDTLRRQLTAANEQIGALCNSVDSLSTTVSAVTGELNAAQEESVKLENELNVCYYAAAAKSELKNHKIIETGFLRQTKLMKGGFDKNFFRTGDKRSLEVVPLGSRKAKILTNHPETSYELIDDGGQKAIRILDPAQFWSLSNYLVVQKD